MIHSNKAIATLSPTQISRLIRLEKQAHVAYPKRIKKVMDAYRKREEKKRNIRAMCQGYTAMGEINLKLANDFPGIDQNDTISF